MDVSVLNASALRLGEAFTIRAGSEATLVFHSDEFGDSPKLCGLVKSTSCAKRFTRLTIEIESWDKLAHFWESVLRH